MNQKSTLQLDLEHNQAVIELDQKEGHHQHQIGTVVGHSGRYLQVKSIYPDELFQFGRSMAGCQQTWNVNHYSFITRPVAIKKAYNISDEEYDALEKQFTFVYDLETCEYQQRN